MKLNDYQTKALSFRLPTATTDYALLNLSGEVGELHSLIAKGIRDGFKDDFAVNLNKELGDVLWCLSAVAADYGLDLEYIAQSNIEKLTKRKENNTITGNGDTR